MNINIFRKHKKGLILLTSILLTLLVTGGIFAYTFTTATSTVVVTLGAGEFADVSANDTPDYTIQGSRKGSIPAAYLFDVNTPSGAGAYTGDVEVQVYLSNVDDLTSNYSFWMMRLELTNAAHSANVSVEGISQVLSLDNPMVSFTLDSDNLTPSAYVYTPGGSYRTYPFGWLSDTATYDPLLFVKVIQREQ